MARQTFRIFLSSLFLLLMTLFSTQSFAFDDFDDQKVQATLIAEVESIQPGQPFWVGIHQDIIPHWHTYWKNPGDSGLPTTVKWDLPDGVTAGDIVWPTPNIYKVGDLTNYGYGDEVFLMTQITPPETLVPGSVFTINAESNWLACEEICIPESVELSLSLPVTNDGSGLSQWASRFEQTKKLVPTTLQTNISATIDDAVLELTVDEIAALQGQKITSAYFYADDGLLVHHAGKQNLKNNNGAFTLTMDRGSGDTKSYETIAGVLSITTDQGDYAYEISVAPSAREAAVKALAAPDQSGDNLDVAESHLTIWTAALFAFLGGIALNLMPCVFPILSMKALSLISHNGHDDKKHVRMGGIAYTAGVMVTFSLLALGLIALRATGVKVGWGIQLQSPAFVLFTAYILFVIGYVLTGALHIGSSLAGFGSKWASKGGTIGSFFTGALAVVVATPCTAPLMGAAIFFALTQPWAVTLLVLNALGFGLALPYLLLTFSPRLLKLMPKPGVWMEHFKQFLAFPMFGAVVWLVWVISQQAGSTGVLLSLSGLVLLAFGLWLYGTLSTDSKKGLWHIIKIIIVIKAIVWALSFTQTIRMTETVTQTAQTSDVFEAYSADRLQELRDEGKPVFVNMTAAWCITCLANERVALSKDSVKTHFKENGIVYLKGDWTNRDSAITSYLKSKGRSGVPLYVYYPVGGEGVVLPQLLTSETIISTLEEANQ